MTGHCSSDTKRHITDPFVGQNNYDSSKCDQTKHLTENDIHYVQKQTLSNSAVQVYTCGYTACELAKNHAPESAYIAIANVCTNSSSDSSGVRIVNQFQAVSGDTGTTVPVTVMVQGTLAKIPYEITGTGA